MVKVNYKKIDGLNDYQVWNNGNIISEKTGSVMGHVQPNGYIRMTLTDNDGNSKTYYAHHLVWRAFMGEIPAGMQINHINECKADNSIWNLELVTPAENNNWGTAKARRSLTMRINKVEERIEAIENALYYWLTREEIDGSEKVIRKTRNGLLTIGEYIEYLNSEKKSFINKLKDLKL